MSAWQRFSVETRDPVWVAVVETYLRERVSGELARLVPGLRVVGIECRTRTCRVTWEPTADVDPLAVMRLTAVLYGPTSGGMAPDRNGVLLSFEDGGQDADSNPEATLALIQRNRQWRLAQLRDVYAAGRRPTTYGEIDPRNLPVD